MTQPKKPKPTDPSSSYLKMKPRWDVAEALLGGTETMRVAGDTYLPQHEQETNNNYNRRLEKATLLNMSEMVLEALVGRPFSKPIIFEGDVPKQIEDWTEDFDLQGNNLQSFCRNWFREGWAKGLAHVLIDFPVVRPAVEGEVRTLADDRAQNLRPFAVRIRPEAVLAAYADVIDGQEVLTHVRILETSVVQDGWGEVIEQRVRVLEPGTWKVYKPDEKGNEWTVEDEGMTPLSFVPLVTFYSGKREALHECKPPLMDLMHLNVEHWQSASDQRNVLTVARFPILAGSGIASTDVMAIGPNNFLTTESVDGKWYYVEHSGKAIEAGEKDLERLKDQMAAYGAEFLKRKTGTETATGRALDSAEGMSYLQATTLDFKDALEQALWFMAQWAKLDDGGSVIVYSNFAAGEAASQDLEQLLKLRATRDISRKAVLDEFQRRGVLSDDFNQEEDAELMLEEAESAQANAADGMGDMFNKGEGTQLGNDPDPDPDADPDADPDGEE